MKGQSGIYKIQSKIKPEKIYIGSAIDIAKRRNKHLRELSKGIHHSLKLQNHVNKYGMEDLSFSIIEPCFSEWLVSREQYYLNTLKPYFNICRVAGSVLGIKRCPDSIKKTADAHRGEKLSEEHRRKLSEAKKGKPSGRIGFHHSEETKQKLKEINIGKKQSVSTIAKRKGKKQSVENIAKRVAKTTGQKRSLEAKYKMSIARLGKRLSAETKMKISMSGKGKRIGHFVSSETCKRISLAKKGKMSSKERMRISQMMKGNKLCIGHKNALGYKFTPEQRKKVSDRLYREWALKKQFKEDINAAI